jgi:DivIVA domain-containing protein
MAHDRLSPEDVRSGKITFARTLRGYDPEQTDRLLRTAEQAAMSDDPQVRAEMARTLRDTERPVVWRGYERDAVDAYTEMLRRDYLLVDDPPRPGEGDRAVPASPGFAVVLRGYDVEQVDNLIEMLQDAARSGDPQRRAEARAGLDNVTLRTAMRGYDREQVDGYLRTLLEALG